MELILRRRGEVLGDLDFYLKEIGHAMSVADVLFSVYEDDNDKDFEEYVMMLADEEAENVEQAEELAMELFNYFPRQTLGGKSLAERMTFDELKEMEIAWQKFKDGTGGEYGYDFEKTKLDDEGNYLVSGSYDGSPMVKDDNCAVCRLERKCKAEGRTPTEGELVAAMFEASNQPH